MNSNPWGNYPDPGLVENKQPAFSQQWGAQPASPAGDWPQRAGNAYLNWRVGDDPMPGLWAPMEEHRAWSDRHLMDLIPGTGIAGPVRAIKSSIPSGGMRTLLEYYKDTNPQKVLGELSYSKLSGQAPVFENIVSNTPRGTGELLEGLQKRLGPMLDQMEITNIQPQATNFWERLANSTKLQDYPNLQTRISDEVGRVKNAWGAVPESSYQANPYRNMGFWK